MPGAADSVASYQTLDERTVIVRAVRVDGEYLRPAARKQHPRIAAMADQLPAVGKIGNSDTSRQIRTSCVSVFRSHSLLLGYRVGVRPAGVKTNCVLVARPLITTRQFVAVTSDKQTNLIAVPCNFAAASSSYQAV